MTIQSCERVQDKTMEYLCNTPDGCGVYKVWLWRPHNPLDCELEENQCLSHLSQMTCHPFFVVDCNHVITITYHSIRILAFHSPIKVEVSEETCSTKRDEWNLFSLKNKPRGRPSLLSIHTENVLEVTGTPME